MARQMDEFVAEHRDFVIIVAAGNLGPGPGTIGSPATAKNVISVGATFNTRAAINEYVERKLIYPMGGDENHLASFSSRGPTMDGRIKPEILAPGTPVLSASAHTGCGEAIRHGTSMAAPHIAGLAAHIRQHYGGASAAMVKAILIQKSSLLPNEPRDNQGFGLVRLDNFNFFKYEIDLDGHMRFRAGGHAKVTLAWTDDVAPRGSHAQLVHNVDLEGLRGKTRFYGNGGHGPDVANNVEQLEGYFDFIQLHGKSRVAVVSSVPLVEMPLPCDKGEVRVCRKGGWGTQKCSHQWGMCVLTSCDSKYRLRGGVCIRDVQETESAASWLWILLIPLFLLLTRKHI